MTRPETAIKHLRVLLLAVAAVLCHSTVTHAIELDGLDKGILAAGVADVATTEWALSSNPHAVESNPLLGGGPAARVLGKAAASAGVIVIRHELRKRGHARGAKIVGIGAVILWSGLAVNNARLARKH